MELLKNIEKAPSLKYSPRKSDMAIEKGIQIRIATNEVTRVPRRKGSAPNLSAAASQVVPQKKVRPKALMAGMEATRRVVRMASRRTTTKTAARRRIPLNLRSDLSTVVLTGTSCVCAVPFACSVMIPFIVQASSIRHTLKAFASRLSILSIT
ncbi:MAG: hypothetical protein A4E63_03374 [Syntrophorhabdus sp. PtaU1.Bin050]|nr:MAG: hypothetical protein A4E63_03374 [Syntrophorhabdus sp. PtaU1.Bin050]